MLRITQTYYHHEVKEFNAVASSCLLSRQHVGEGALYLRGGGEAGGREMCDWQEIPQKDSLFCLFDAFPHFLLIFMIVIDFPSLIPAVKTTAFPQRPPGFGISEVLLSFGRTDCEDEERTSSQLLKHTCFFFTHAFKILWDLITFVFISTNRTTALHNLSTSHSLPLFEWIAVPPLYFDNTFSIFSQQPSSHVTQWLHTSVWLCCYSR